MKQPGVTQGKSSTINWAKFPCWQYMDWIGQIPSLLCCLDSQLMCYWGISAFWTTWSCGDPHFELSWHTCSIVSMQSFLREKCYESFNRTNSSKKNLKEIVNNSKQTYWREVIWKGLLTTHYLKGNLKDQNNSASSSKIKKKSW